MRGRRVLIALASAGALIAAVAIVWGFAARAAEFDRVAAEAAQASQIRQEQREAEAARAEAEAAAAAEAERVAGLVPLEWPAGRPLRVALYGDSVSYGQHSVTEASAFRSILLSKLSQFGTVDWVGRYWAGARVEDMAATITPQLGIDLSIVELGLNDVFKQTDPAAFESQYAGWLDTIKSRSPETQVLCLGIWGGKSSANERYDEIIERICKERGGRYISLNQAFTSANSRGPAGNQYWAGETDAGHPNDIGHAKIAQLIIDRLPGLIPAGQTVTG